MAAPVSVWGRLRSRVRTESPQVLRIVVAAAVSWQLCLWLGATQPPVFAVVVPLVALRDHPYSVFNLSVDRMIGVICGVVLADLVVRWLGLSLLGVVVVLAVGLSVGVVLRVGTVLNVQAAISGMLVFASADPGSYSVNRLWETAVGALVCVVLSPLLLPPNARKSFEAELAAVAEALSSQLRSLRRLVERPPGFDDAALAELSEATVRTEELARGLPASLTAAQRAVRNNPLRRADVPRLARHTEDVRICVEVARLERLLLDEVADLSTRPDLHEVWPEFVEPLRRVLEPAEEAVRLRVGGSPDHDRLNRLGAQLNEEIERWRQRDTRPVAAVMRRPLRRLHAVLAGVAPSSDPGNH